YNWVYEIAIGKNISTSINFLFEKVYMYSSYKCVKKYLLERLGGTKDMPKKPPVHELKFLKLSPNYFELTSKLSELGCPNHDINQYAQHVCEAWFRLGEQHLEEAKQLLHVGCLRAAYSRAYYAAYNASKGTRYIYKGFVSLKGDDHGKASTELPPDFPDVANWASTISVLYEHRLHADYDNWSDTPSTYTLQPNQAIKEAENFISEARDYINNKFGMEL
ncbi:MAG: HEPN domain-containing protein, partial [Polynucleobacter sp.]|nr:HEPN domain-containing protein [Polynucleobacter sp.]